jgi:NADH-quinone oxidoreductase subunit M
VSLHLAWLDGCGALTPSWIYTAFATTGVILAAVYLLKMYQAVFMGPLDNPKNQALRDMNGGELAIMLGFLVFIVWIGIAPSGYFALMDSTVAQLAADLRDVALVAR